jgi:uncharacterized protein (DUF488 family)
VEIYTIGFTQTTAEHFFDRLIEAGIERLIDVRLKNVSQLAGFAAVRDLPYFLEQLAGVEYEHAPLLAPTEDLLRAYRKRTLDWDNYERGFLWLMAEREIHNVLRPEDFNTPTALLCSEATADCCHRRLLGEYLAEHWSDLRMEHL